MSEALRLADLLVSSPQYSGTTIWQAAAELRRLHAEVDRLTKCITYEQHRAERIGTHGPGCHTWGPQHYECAKRLNAELVEALRIAEAGLADIGDADREPGDDLAWCEQRAAEALPAARAALEKVEASK